MVSTPNQSASASLSADTLSQRLLVWFPVVLFLPQGMVNASMGVLLLLLLGAGNWRERLASLRQHPMLPPALAMLGLCIVNGLLLQRSADYFSGFAHYQDFLFLFVFMAAGPGAWQKQAVRTFYWAATVAGLLLFLARANLLPQWGILASYNFYGGNKSILLAMLLAVAACWMLSELLQSRQRDWIAIARFLFICLAVATVAKSRTAQLILFLGCGGILLVALRSKTERVAALLLIVVAAVVATQALPKVKARLDGSVADLQAFAHGGKVSDDGQRLDIYRVTLDMIADKPLTGYGVGAWFENYKARIPGTGAPLHSTPHNDYLLHCAELGLPGLALLFWALWVQSALSRRLARPQSLQLATLSMAIILGAMFNAILRDFAFAIPFIYLLAILLTGISRNRAET